MFSKLSLLFLAVPCINALTLDTPTDATSGGQLTVTWTSAAGDPSTFSLELVNQAFNDAFAVANNVDPSLGTITFELGIVPVGPGYTIEAVNIGNINDVFATSGTFSVGPISSSSVSGSSASAATAPSSSSTKVPVTATGLTVSATTTTGLSTTPTTTSPATISSAGSATTSSASTKTNAATPMRFALASSNAGAIAVALMTVVGGAAAFIL